MPKATPTTRRYEPHAAIEAIGAAGCIGDCARPGFEETSKDLTQNFASLDFDLNDLVARNQTVLDFVYVESSE